VVEGGFVNSEGLSMSLTARLTAEQKQHFHVRQQSSSIVSMYANRAAAAFPYTSAEQQQQHAAGEQKSSSSSEHQHSVVDSEIPTESKMKQESRTNTNSNW
jgi:hypothetical protein